MKGSRPLESEEYQKLLEACLTPREAILLVLGRTLGLRIGEAVKIRLKDVLGEYMKIKSSKGSNDATFKTPSEIHALIPMLKEYYPLEKSRTYLRKTCPLMCSQKGGMRPISERQAGKIFKDIVKRSGISTPFVSYHSLRKSFIWAAYINTGRDLIRTQQYSRHKRLSSLSYYLKTIEKLVFFSETGSKFTYPSFNMRKKGKSWKHSQQSSKKK